MSGDRAGELLPPDLLARRQLLRREWDAHGGWGGRATLARITCERRRHLLGEVWRSAQGLAVATRDNRARLNLAHLPLATPPAPGEDLDKWQSFASGNDDRGELLSILELLGVLAEGGGHVGDGLWCECGAWGRAAFEQMRSLCAAWAVAPPKRVRRVILGADGAVALDAPHPPSPRG